jgi:hypothetical protein
MGVHLGVWVFILTLSHTPGLLSWPTFLWTLALVASPRLGSRQDLSYAKTTHAPVNILNTDGDKMEWINVWETLIILDNFLEPHIIGGLIKSQDLIIPTNYWCIFTYFNDSMVVRLINIISFYSIIYATHGLLSHEGLMWLTLIMKLGCHNAI